MSDDDVEYIGTKNAQRLPVSDHPFPPGNRPLNAVVLHVERTKDKPPYGMWFRQSEFSVVNIGRRPGGVTVEKRFEYTMSGRAMFRCPVVSRKHAKIVFSDTQAYLIDLNSHHGTHILKPGETVSTMLKPETPTVLANNDTVTFGKTVGRGDHVVDPVVVRIGLVYGPTESSATNIPDLVAQDGTVAKAPTPVKPLPKPRSGYYGVHVPCSLVSDESSPNSSNDSDIEELDGPPPPTSDPASKPNPTTKSIQLPALSSVTSFLFNSPDKAPVIDVASRSPSPFIRPPSSSPLYDPYSPRFSPPSEFFPPWRSWGLTVVDPPRAADALPRLTWDPLELIQPSQSRSSSPMDLSSSSSSPPPRQEAEAWPISRSPSPFIFDREPVVDLADVAVDAGDANTTAKATETSSVDVNAPESRQTSPHCQLVVETPATGHGPPCALTKDMFTALEAKLGSEVAAVQSSISGMRGDVAKLHAHRRKYKTRFNANVHTIAEKLTDLDERIANANAQYSSMSQRLDNAVPADLHTAMETMEARITALSLKKAAAETTEAAQAAERVTASLGELQAMMAEISALRQRAETEITADVQAVKAACKRAMHEIASQVETPLHPSLKRKRSDDEGEVEDAGVNVAVGGVVAAAAGKAVVESDSSIAPVVVSKAVQTRRPSAKRMRRVMSTVVHTATAMTLGAVATWGALAFS